MAVIYRTTDRITVAVDDLKIKIAPLSFSQKQEIAALITEGQKAGDVLKVAQGSYLAVRYGLKDIDGVVDSHGERYQLEFDEDGKLSEQSFEEITNMELSDKIVQVCAKLLNGVPESWEVEGVKFAKEGLKKKKEK